MKALKMFHCKILSFCLYIMLPSTSREFKVSTAYLFNIKVAVNGRKIVNAGKMGIYFQL